MLPSGIPDLSISSSSVLGVMMDQIHVCCLLSTGRHNSLQWNEKGNMVALVTEASHGTFTDISLAITSPMTL